MENYYWYQIQAPTPAPAENNIWVQVVQTSQVPPPPQTPQNPQVTYWEPLFPAHAVAPVAVPVAQQAVWDPYPHGAQYAVAASAPLVAEPPQLYYCQEGEVWQYQQPAAAPAPAPAPAPASQLVYVEVHYPQQAQVLQAQVQQAPAPAQPAEVALTAEQVAMDAMLREHNEAIMQIQHAGAVDYGTGDPYGRRYVYR